jgi:hypothetical protein
MSPPTRCKLPWRQKIIGSQFAPAAASVASVPLNPWHEVRRPTDDQ